MIEYMCDNGQEVLLYTNFSEVINDSLSYKINEFSDKYENFYVMNIDQESALIDYSTSANSMLVTSGTSNVYHSIDYNLCKKVSCKTFAIQHGISQEGITRLGKYHFSADYVLTWIKGEHILDNVTTPIDKFISVGIPNHYYDKTDCNEGSKVFFFTNGFDKPNYQDIKLETNGGEWSGIYTTKWKDETWKRIEELSEGVCYFVRHPTVNGGELHPTLTKILKNKNKFLVDNAWLEKNNLNRSQLYSIGSKYYVTYPSSCWIDCLLNSVDYETFKDYNSNIDILLEDSIEGFDRTIDICKLLLK
tara:strand:+ start:1702 stop:2613 length:912 start_codon:yes stop_codon:yes gene_type:complete